MPIDRFVRKLVLISICLFVVNATPDLNAQRNKQAARTQQTAAIDALIRQMDGNKNGYIDPTEMKGLAKKYAERSGLDLRRSHQISKVVEAVRTKGKNSKTTKKTKTDRKVPDFSVEPPERLGVPDFSPSGEERMTVDMMKRKFSSSVMSQVEKTLSRNDKNKSGILESDEIARSRWSNPTWQESDTNKDGKLTRLELAYRYKGREDAAKESAARRAASRAKKTTTTKSSQRDKYISSRTRSLSGRTSRSSSERSSSSKSTSSSSRSRRGFNSGSDAYKRYAEGLLKSYDKDKDGRLNKTELKDMRRPPKNADKNRDGYVDKSELIASVEERSGVKKSGDSKKNSSAEKLRRNTSEAYNQDDSIFGGKDLNNDRQLQMREFSEEWNDEIVKEFEEKDLNGDGVITEAEWNGRRFP